MNPEFSREQISKSSFESILQQAFSNMTNYEKNSLKIIMSLAKSVDELNNNKLRMSKYIIEDIDKLISLVRSSQGRKEDAKELKNIIRVFQLNLSRYIETPNDELLENIKDNIKEINDVNKRLVYNRHKNQTEEELKNQEEEIYYEVDVLIQMQKILHAKLETEIQKDLKKLKIDIRPFNFTKLDRAYKSLYDAIEREDKEEVICKRGRLIRLFKANEEELEKQYKLVNGLEEIRIILEQEENEDDKLQRINEILNRRENYQYSLYLSSINNYDEFKKEFYNLYEFLEVHKTILYNKALKEELKKQGEELKQAYNSELIDNKHQSSALTKSLPKTFGYSIRKLSNTITKLKSTESDRQKKSLRKEIAKDLGRIVATPVVNIAKFTANNWYTLSLLKDGYNSAKAQKEVTTKLPIETLESIKETRDGFYEENEAREQAIRDYMKLTGEDYITAADRVDGDPSSYKEQSNDYERRAETLKVSNPGLIFKRNQSKEEQIIKQYQEDQLEKEKDLVANREKDRIEAKDGKNLENFNNPQTESMSSSSDNTTIREKNYKENDDRELAIKAYMQLHQDVDYIEARNAVDSEEANGNNFENQKVINIKEIFKKDNPHLNSEEAEKMFSFVEKDNVTYKDILDKTEEYENFKSGLFDLEDYINEINRKIGSEELSNEDLIGRAFELADEYGSINAAIDRVITLDTAINRYAEILRPAYDDSEPDYEDAYRKIIYKESKGYSLDKQIEDYEGNPVYKTIEKDYEIFKENDPNNLWYDEYTLKDRIALSKEIQESQNKTKFIEILGKELDEIEVERIINEIDLEGETSNISYIGLMNARSAAITNYRSYYRLTHNNNEISYMQAAEIIDSNISSFSTDYYARLADKYGEQTLDALVNLNEMAHAAKVIDENNSLIDSYKHAYMTYNNDEANRLKNILATRGIDADLLIPEVYTAADIPIGIPGPDLCLMYPIGKLTIGVGSKGFYFDWKGGQDATLGDNAFLRLSDGENPFYTIEKYR